MLLQIVFIANIKNVQTVIQLATSPSFSLLNALYWKMASYKIIYILTYTRDCILQARWSAVFTLYSCHFSVVSAANTNLHGNILASRFYLKAEEVPDALYLDARYQSARNPNIKPVNNETNYQHTLMHLKFTTAKNRDLMH